MTGRVCVIGSANMDMTVRADRLPAPGETLHGSSFKTSPGGKGANQAVAAARMGARVTFVGRVGADASGTELRKALGREGVDLTALRTAADVSTGVALITVDEQSGENTIVVVGGANMRVTPEDVRGVGGLIRSAEVLLMQLEVPVDAVEAATAQAHASGRKVVLNAAPARPLPESLLRALDVLIVNRPEAAELVGSPGDTSPEELAGALLKLGPTAVIVTLGASGAIIADADGQALVPSVGVHAVDAVGAGDAFCGSIAAMLAEGRALREAVRVACVAGALATTRQGAIPSLPSRSAVGEVLTSKVP